MNVEAAHSPEPAEGLLHGLLRRVVDVRPAEVPALAWSWLYIFAVLSSYYIMRPIRDQMGVAGGVRNLQWLFTGTLVTMLILNIPFWYLVKRLPRTRFIPIAYRFFAANILLFALALYFASPDQMVWIGRAFFIWISVFSLFVVSVFWQLIVDIFSSEQGKRLFGFIAAGATIGAIFGSGVIVALVRHVPVPLLLIGAALLLEVAVYSVGRLARQSAKLHSRPAAHESDAPVGGHVLAGITNLKSPYLLNLSAFILLFAVTSTFLYFQQAGIVSRGVHDRAAQTAVFASIDNLVNWLTLFVQLLLTGRIMRWLGVGPTLAFLPALTILSFGTLAMMPTVATLITIQVLRRSSDYAIARPTREVLYTVVPREDRYKAKSFIDTVVYRAGDQIGAWAFAFLSWLGLGSGAIALTAVGLSMLWLGNGLWLGRREAVMAAAETAPPATAAASNQARR